MLIPVQPVSRPRNSLGAWNDRAGEERPRPANGQAGAHAFEPEDYNEAHVDEHGRSARSQPAHECCERVPVRRGRQSRFVSRFLR